MEAIPGMQALISRKALFELASEEDVESRLVRGDGESQPWQMRSGPFKLRALPPVSRPNWTLLVQGVNLHSDAADALLRPGPTGTNVMDVVALLIRG